MFNQTEKLSNKIVVLKKPCQNFPHLSAFRVLWDTKGIDNCPHLGWSWDQQGKVRSFQVVYGSTAWPQGFLSIWKQFDTLTIQKQASKQTNPTAEPTKLSSSESCWVAILFQINLISMQLLGDNLSNQWCTLAKPNLCIWVSHRWPNFIFFFGIGWFSSQISHI